MHSIRFVQGGGGVGTTTVAVAVAASLAHMGHRALLVGHDPDPIASILGMPQVQAPDCPGVILHAGDFANTNRPSLALAVMDTCGESSFDWNVRAFAQQYEADVIVLDGTDYRADRTFLVARPCYMGLRSAIRKGYSGPNIDGVVYVPEKGRALAECDVAAVVDSRIVARIPRREGIARAVDAGCLTWYAGRHPEFDSLRMALEAAA